MEINKLKSIIEAILFATGREVTKRELILSLEITEEALENIISSMQEEYKQSSRGIEIIKVDNGYQMASKKEFYDYLYPIFDSRVKPSLSNAALEVLAIISYNPKITRAEIDAIRGVNSDGTIYRLLEYNLIEDAGKIDAPGKPIGYKTTQEFLKMFGISSLDDLPELPKYKLDENEQIVIDEFSEDTNNNSEDPSEVYLENKQGTEDKINEEDKKE